MKKLYLFISLFFANIGLVFADASASLSVNHSTIENGSKVTASVKVKNTAAWNIKIASSGATSGCTQRFADATSDGNNTTKTFTVTCKATSTGIINFVLSGDITSSDGKNISVSGSKQVNVEKAREKSSNNNLKSLSVEGYDISPSFSKNTKEYSVSVPSTVESINIHASKESSYATIKGAGEKNLSEGINNFEIVVTSETGVSNTYKLIVNVEDKTPINVNVDGKKYTVVKEARNLTKPELFDETTITIDEFTIPAFKNESCNYTLVGLKDEDGKVSLFIYDNGKYTKYNEIQSGKINLIILNLKEIEGEEKTTFTINEQKVSGYIIDGNEIIYAINIENGKKNFYKYEDSEKTFQIYTFNEEVSQPTELNNLNYILLGVILFLILIIIIILVSNKKKIENITERFIKKEEEYKNKKRKRSND